MNSEELEAQTIGGDRKGKRRAKMDSEPVKHRIE